MTREKIPLAGVIGHPIAHSKSPKLHGHWLKTYGIAGHYVPMDVHPSDLAAVLKSLPKAGFVGANVTIPHKEAALALCDEVSSTAQRIGAANTLTFTAEGRVLGDNTDAIGFIENLRQNAPLWQPADGAALVIGAGGAARAVLVALLDAGVPQIYLSNRSADRAQTLAREFGPRITGIEWSQTQAQMASVQTLVNTAALGMTGKDPFPFTLDQLPASALVTDIVYSPLETDLLRAAKDKGCTTVDGLGMLLHQAAPGFARWFGQTPLVDDALRRAVLE